MKDFKSMIEWYDDEDGNEVKTFGKMIDGKKEGTWVYYRTGGEVIGLVDFKDGKRNGKTIAYIDGEISSVVRFKNDIEDGKSEEYYKGLRIEEKEFVKGIEINKKTISGEKLFEHFPNLTADNV